MSIYIYSSYIEEKTKRFQKQMLGFVYNFIWFVDANAWYYG